MATGFLRPAGLAEDGASDVTFLEAGVTDLVLLPALGVTDLATRTAPPPAALAEESVRSMGVACCCFLDDEGSAKPDVSKGTDE